MDADSLRLLFDLLRTALIHSLDIYFQKNLSLFARLSKREFIDIRLNVLTSS